MKPPGMGLSLGTGVQQGNPAGGLQDIDDGLICCASLLQGVKEGKQMSALYETLRVGEHS